VTIHIIRGKKLCPDGTRRGGRIQISSNRGGSARWKHGTLPRYEPTRWGPRATRDKIHLFWTPLIFFAVFPKERKEG
jgi:hypothetical protein